MENAFKSGTISKDLYDSKRENIGSTDYVLEYAKEVVFMPDEFDQMNNYAQKSNDFRVATMVGFGVSLVNLFSGIVVQSVDDEFLNQQLWRTCSDKDFDNLKDLTYYEDKEKRILEKIERLKS